MADRPAAAGRRVRRIVLALDMQTADLSAMERATALAARLHGELMALYVEDIDLVRLAEHGSISAFSTVSAVRRELASGHLRDSLRLQAQRLRREVEQAAARRQVKCAFQVRQGRLLAEVLSAAGDDDLVVISWSGPERAAPWGAGPPPSAVAQALAEARVRSALLLHPRAGESGPVLVAFDGSEAARHALDLAAQVADLDGGLIEVALLAGRRDEADAWGAEIAAALSGGSLALALLHAPKADLAMLVEMAARRRSALLVLGAERALAEGDVGHRLLRRLPCSVLLVR